MLGRVGASLFVAGDFGPSSTMVSWAKESIPARGTPHVSRSLLRSRQPRVVVGHSGDHGTPSFFIGKKKKNHVATTPHD